MRGTLVRLLKSCAPRFVCRGEVDATRWKPAGARNTLADHHLSKSDEQHDNGYHCSLAPPLRGYQRRKLGSFLVSFTISFQQGCQSGGVIVETRLRADASR